MDCIGLMFQQTSVSPSAFSKGFTSDGTGCTPKASRCALKYKQRSEMKPSIAVWIMRVQSDRLGDVVELLEGDLVEFLTFGR